MKKVFIDTNIFVDLLIARKPFDEDASTLITHIENGNLKGYTSVTSFINLHFICSKYLGASQTIQSLKLIEEMIELVSIDQKIIHTVLYDNFKDFEDGIQILSAQTVKGLDAIVTRNVKDFKKAHVPVFSPNDFLAGLT